MQEVQGPSRENDPATQVTDTAALREAATVTGSSGIPDTGDSSNTGWGPEASRWIKLLPVSAICMIVALGGFLYSHTLDFPFHFDDHIYLLNNPFVMQAQEFLFERSFHDVANHSLTLGLGYDPSVNFILRPVAYLTFHLNYLAHGFTPAGFRIVNIAIHCANAALVFLLLTFFLRRSPKAAGLSEGSILFIPFAVGLLFVAHPLHTESVTYIVQRFTSLVVTFLLTSLLLHLLSLTVRSRVYALALRTAAVIVTAAGMLTKESMFTVPILMVMLHVVVMGGTLKRACWQALPHLLCMLIIPVLVLVTSQAQAATGHQGGAMHIAASSKDGAYQLHYFMTQLGVVLEYVRLILWPQGLNVDRQYQLATSVLQLRVWLSAVVIVGILVGAWRLYRARPNSIRHVLMVAGALWFFLRLAITSSFVPLDDLMVDHRTYAPSIGLFILLVCALDLFRTSEHRWIGVRWTAPALLGAWVTLLGGATFLRNEVWRTEASLWADAVAKSPGKPRPWDNLGVCHFQEGRPDEAAACLLKTLELNPGYIPGYIKLGVLYNTQSKFTDSVDLSRQGLLIAPDAAPMHFNLGYALCHLNRTEEGIASLESAVRLMPTMANGHLILGRVHENMKNHAKALHHLRIAASLGINDADLQQTISQLEVLTGPQLAN